MSFVSIMSSIVHLPAFFVYLIFPPAQRGLRRYRRVQAYVQKDVQKALACTGGHVQKDVKMYQKSTTMYMYKRYIHIEHHDVSRLYFKRCTEKALYEDVLQKDGRCCKKGRIPTYILYPRRRARLPAHSRLMISTKIFSMYDDICTGISSLPSDKRYITMPSHVQKEGKRGKRR